MSDPEFGEHAAAIADRIRMLPPQDRIAAACRGSGNPGALAWLAEGLALGDTTAVVDLGAGLGGPAAWMRARYGCRVVAVEPEAPAARAAASIFELPSVVAAAGQAPFAADSFDVAFLFGVVSVTSSPGNVLAEASRVARALGLLDYCSTGQESVSAGGSMFRTKQHLCEVVGSVWRIDECLPVSLSTPRRWAKAADKASHHGDADEAEVVRAIDDGRIAPVMMVARR